MFYNKYLYLQVFAGPADGRGSAGSSYRQGDGGKRVLPYCGGQGLQGGGPQVGAQMKIIY